MGETLPDRIPLFPLPNVALFPEMPLPLHVFEPRYRQMVADVRAAGHETIGMVLLQPGWEPSYYGRPAVFPLGCAGRIEQCEALPDGRYNMVLRGTARFTIVDEPVGPEPYRMARVVARPDHADEPALEAARQDLIAAIERASEQEVVLLHGHLPPALFVNALCQSLDLEPVERQALLDCDDVVLRCRRLIEILQFKHLERRGGPGRLH
jgi:Lon protease-like protein